MFTYVYVLLFGKIKEKISIQKYIQNNEDMDHVFIEEKRFIIFTLNCQQECIVLSRSTLLIDGIHYITLHVKRGSNEVSFCINFFAGFMFESQKIWSSKPYVSFRKDY